MDHWQLLCFLLAIAVSSGNALRDLSYRRVQERTNSSCMIDFSYVRRFPTTIQLCRSSATASEDASVCCPALLNTFGIGLAEYLKLTGGFELPDMPTVTSCLSSYQAALNANGATKSFEKTCFPVPYTSTSMFIQAPSCAGIVNISDWNRVVGRHALDESCAGDLTDAGTCQSCTDDVTKAVVRLQSVSNGTHDQQCVYVACLYAAAMVNRFGPQEPSTAYCLLGITAPSVARESKKQKVGLYVGVAVGTALGVFLLLGALALGLLRRRRTEEPLVEDSTQEQLSRMPNVGLIKFSYDELKDATQNFSETNFLGEGGYGRVYRGLLTKRGNSEVAVKVMKNSSQENNAEFLNEVEVINRVRHRHLVHIRGACVLASGPPSNHKHILVYDYMPNGCLQDYLSSGTKPVLSWPERRKLAVGMAVGINYLHNEVQPAIIHRDIKPSNILLDEDFNARVADFGLAKISPEGMTHLTTRVAGTPVYMAIEYALYGQCSEKVDVYSFGIVLLELMSGRKALDTTEDNPMHFHIVDWAWSLVKAGQVDDIIDAHIRDDGPVSVMRRFVLVGILCAHLVVGFRPSMSQALKMLEGDEEIPPIPDRPAPYMFANPESPNSLPPTEPLVDSSELLR